MGELEHRIIQYVLKLRMETSGFDTTSQMDHDAYWNNLLKKIIKPIF